MVERTKSEGFDEFEGVVEDIVVEPSNLKDVEGDQYHITMKPVDEDLLKDSKTGLMHEWIRVSAKATDTSVPEGSILDKYVQEIEIQIPEAKKVESVPEVFALMKGKTFLFKKKILGKSFDGHEAKGYWTPVKLIE